MIQVLVRKYNELMLSAPVPHSRWEKTSTPTFLGALARCVNTATPLTDVCITSEFQSVSMRERQRESCIDMAAWALMKTRACSRMHTHHDYFLHWSINSWFESIKIVDLLHCSLGSHWTARHTDTHVHILMLDVLYIINCKLQMRSSRSYKFTTVLQVCNKWTCRHVLCVGVENI